MTPPDIVLDELERDALTELVNIGVSRAAAGLRKMVGEEILLSVPAVEVVDHRTAAALIEEREGDELIAVKQDFSGAFQGRALLIFPHAKSLDLVRAVVGAEMPVAELLEIQQEALAETGNVILNSCLAAMANMLRQSVKMSLPEVIAGGGRALLASDASDPSDPEGLVLFLYINFFVRDRSIRGYIAMVMDLPSLAALKLLVGDFIARVMGDDIGQSAIPP
ncbi:MAG: chemotaxis protein CheX [Pseudomonadota bacterium]